MSRIAFRCLSLAAAVSLIPAAAQAQSAEQGRLCEAKPIMRCLDKSKIEGDTLRVPLDDVAIQKDGFLICDSSYNYVTAPDIVLVMDNTGSMDSLSVLNGIPRYCATPNSYPDDPGCISGDPDRLRGPALQSFLDSALVKGGSGINVGIVTFATSADATSDHLLPLTSKSIDSIKASIKMSSLGSTNYTAAFNKARELLATSHKPKSQQFIIFISDGRPNWPPRPEDPYAYKQFLDSLPETYTIFLGGNVANYVELQEIADSTKGAFFPITDVHQLAGYLTDNIAKKLFTRALPTLTTVRNLTDSITFQVDAAKHIPQPDSGAYTLDMPGPLYLVQGVNDIVVSTEYGYGGVTQDVHFKIARTSTGPYFAGLQESCRAPARLVIYNYLDSAISDYGKPLTIGDSVAKYKLTTNAPLDSFDLIIRVTSPVSAQQDLEAAHNTLANKTDSTWSGSEPLQHQTPTKVQGDGRLQVDHGETVTFSYQNPYIREDTATARVKIKYGPELDKAAYWDNDGDGRIETVVIKYLEALANLPDSLRFDINDAAGKSASRVARAGAIQFATNPDNSQDRTRLIVTLPDPFPYGMTSVLNADSSGRTFRQINIPMVDARFRVDDSVPPVIIGATVTTDKSDGQPLVDVVYSEPVKLADHPIQPIVFRRDTVIFTTKDMPIGRIDSIGAREYGFHIQAGAVFKPVGGDSVAINNNGETRDLAGLTPKTRTWAPVAGAAPSQGVSDFYFTFANGSHDSPVPSPESPDKGVRFIPVDRLGAAIPGNSNGKCGSCAPLQDGLLTGSVLVVVTKQPVTYELTIFSNLGQVVTHGSGRIEEQDLSLLDHIDAADHDPNQTQYVQRIVWTGQTESGQKAGTGAYVMKAVFKYDRNFKTGAQASTNTRYYKFGFLRSCCDGFNKRWFD